MLEQFIVHRGVIFAPGKSGTFKTDEPGYTDLATARSESHRHVGRYT